MGSGAGLPADTGLTHGNVEARGATFRSQPLGSACRKAASFQMGFELAKILPFVIFIDA